MKLGLLPMHEGRSEGLQRSQCGFLSKASPFLVPLVKLLANISIFSSVGALSLSELVRIPNIVLHRDMARKGY